MQWLLSALLLLLLPEDEAAADAEMPTRSRLSSERLTTEVAEAVAEEDVWQPMETEEEVWQPRETVLSPLSVEDTSTSGTASTATLASAGTVTAAAAETSSQSEEGTRATNRFLTSLRLLFPTGVAPDADGPDPPPPPLLTLLLVFMANFFTNAKMS